MIVPQPYSGTGPFTADTPFYGLGTWSFALDYPQMDIRYLSDPGPLGDLAVPWIGGLVHELGHGLNLSHDRSLVSDQARFGESLMSGGNWTYGRSPTRLTAPSAAILNTSQVFQKTVRQDLDEAPEVTSLGLDAVATQGRIEIAGRLTTTGPVSRVLAFLDPEGGDDYDRVGWVAKPYKSRFGFSLPVRELPAQSGRYELQIEVVFANGVIERRDPVPFVLTNGVANLNHHS